MTVRDTIAAAVKTTLDTVTDAEREDAGDVFAAGLAADIATLDAAYPFPRTVLEAAAYLAAVQEVVGSAVTRIFNNSLWRDQFALAIADGVLEVLDPALGLVLYDSPVWTSGASFNKNELCQAAGVQYSSKIDGNTANPPASSPSAWETSSNTKSIQDLAAALTALQVFIDANVIPKG